MTFIWPTIEDRIVLHQQLEIANRDYENCDSAAVRCELAMILMAIRAAIYPDETSEAISERKRQEMIWIKNARLSFDPGQSRQCSVCAEFDEITHAHHVLPLSEQARFRFVRPDHTFIWLCPNHHSIVHIMMRHNFDELDYHCTLNTMLPSERSKLNEIIAEYRQMKTDVTRFMRGLA